MPLFSVSKGGAVEIMANNFPTEVIFLGGSCPSNKGGLPSGVISHRVNGVSECWVFYAVPTARVIFTAKTSLDIFSLSREQVWTFSVFGDRIYEMRCPFVAVGPNARFIVLPHWDNMS